jgi:uncharacterized protein (DUF433 family)
MLAYAKRPSPARRPNALSWLEGGNDFMERVIVKNPAVLSGEPVFRGTRVPFKALTDYLQGGQSLDEFLEQYPSVTREAAVAALEEARDSLVEHLG